jgi:hypothetical protein
MAPGCLNINGLQVDKSGQWFLFPTFELINAAIVKVSGTGADIESCMKEIGFPQEMNTSLENIDKNTSSMPTSNQMVSIKPNPVVFDSIHYLDQPIEEEIAVITNTTKATWTNVDLQVHTENEIKNSNFYNPKFVLVEVKTEDGNMHLKEEAPDVVDGKTTCSIPFLAPNESIYVVLGFNPQWTDNTNTTQTGRTNSDDNNIFKTEKVTGLLAVFACSYVASPTAECEQGEQELHQSITKSTGAAKLLVTISGENEDTVVEYEMESMTSDSRERPANSYLAVDDDLFQKKLNCKVIGASIKCKIPKKYLDLLKKGKLTFVQLDRRGVITYKEPLRDIRAGTKNIRRIATRTKKSLRDDRKNQIKNKNIRNKTTSTQKKTKVERGKKLKKK